MVTKSQSGFSLITPFATEQFGEVLKDYGSKKLDIPKDSTGDILATILGSDTIDHSKFTDTKTWTYLATDWKLSDGTTVFCSLGELKVTLIRVPLLNRPFFRLYCTYKRTITSKEWRTRPYRGGRNPQSEGYLTMDVDFLNSAGGYINGWDDKFYLYCNDNNREVSLRSPDFSDDFFDAVKDLDLSRGGHALVRCG